MHCCPHCVSVGYCVGIVALLYWHHYPPCAVLPPLSCWRCCPHHCTVIGLDVGVLHHLWSQNDVIMSWLRLTVTLDCFPHPSYTYTKCLSTLIWRPLAYISSLTQLYLPYSAQILGSVSLVESKWCHCVMVDADTTLKLLHASILDIYTVVEHIDMLSIGTW